MSEEQGTREKTLEPRREARKTQLREGVRRVWRTTALRRCLEWGFRLVLGAVLASGQVLEGCSPFGVALVAACGPGAGGFAALLGAVGGYLLSRGLDEALRYAACSILVFSVSFAFYDLSIYRKPWFMPLAAAFLNALTGAATVYRRAFLRPAAYPALVAEFALTVLGVYAFQVAFTLWRGRREEGSVADSVGAQGSEATFRQRVCLVLLAMAVLISLSGLTLAGTVSVGRLAALWLTLWAGHSFGVGGGTAVGLCVGLAMDLAGHHGGIYAPAFAFSGLTAGIFRKSGRFVTALSCAVVGAIAALWSWEQGSAVIMVGEVLIAGGLFLVTPQRLFDRLAPLFDREDLPYPATYAAQAAQRQLRETAAAFRQVFSSLKSAVPAGGGGTNEDPAVIYDRAANKLCSRCPLRERCWQSQYQDTHDLLNAALPGLLEARAANAALLPQRFRDRCVHLPGFVAAVDEELRAYLMRQQYDRRVGRSRLAVCRQYAQVAEVLEDAAAAMSASYTMNARKTRRLSRFLAGRELRCQGVVFTDPQGRLRLRLTGPDAAALATDAAISALSSALEAPLILQEAATPQRPQTLLRQREPLSALAGVAGRRKAGETVSGDACAWFKDDSGHLYLLLCDGMGSGREARQESELAIDLLEKFLKAGFSAENALKNLDQTFSLRLDEALGFSTVDLLVLDLFSGAGTLYKLGSAPSCLKQGGTVKLLRGKGFPAGLTAEGGGAARGDSFDLQLGPGDCLALLTDGIFDGGDSPEGGSDDQWLRQTMMEFEGESPAALAQAIVDHTDDAGDDKTALVLRVTLRDLSDLPFPDAAAV